MAWSSPITFVSGNVLTAAQLNTNLRDNLLTTAPALATGAGSLFVGTAANAIAQRICGSNIVTTGEDCVLTSFGNITGGTVGPTVTVTTGTFAFVVVSCQLQNTSSGARSYMSFAVSGATTTAAASQYSLVFQSPNAGGLHTGSRVVLSPLTAGSNTFQAKYMVSAGTGNFAQRELSVLNFGQ